MRRQAISQANTQALNGFPKEFSGGVFKHPDKRFLTILALCAFFMGGTTFLLSLRDISKEISEKEIVEIQSRYARLVLNIPLKKKEKTAPPAIKEKKKEEVSRIKIEPVIEEIPPVIEKEIKPEEIVPDLAEIETRLSNKYDIKKEALQLDVGEENKFDLPGGPKAPDIDTLSKKKYNTRASGIELDVDMDKAPLLGSASRIPDIGAERGSDYGKARKTKLLAIGAAIDMPDDSDKAGKRKRAQVLSAPDVNIDAGRTYGTKRMSRQVDIAEHSTAAKPKSPAFKPPDVSIQYGTKKRTPSASSSAPELAAKKESAPAIKPRKKGGFLPETAGIRHLTACVDPAEESRLKRQIISKIDDEGQYCESRSGKFEFINVDMVTTLDIRFVSKGRVESSRCEALQLALQCLMKSAY